MMKRSLKIVPLWFLLCVPCVMAQTVKVNWQESAPFSSYHTYAWRGGRGRPDIAQFYQQWVEKDVDEQMVKKGLRRVEMDQNPDLILFYHIAAQEVMDATTMVDGFGWGGGPWRGWGGWGGWGLGGGIAETTAEPRMMGILTIDIADANAKKIVWRGQATIDNISNKQKGDEKQVQKSVEKMFKQFPPPPK